MPGSLIVDVDGDTCVVLKTWAYEDRVSALKDGNLVFVPINDIEVVFEAQSQEKAASHNK